MPYEFPGPNPMADTPSSRKASDFYDWLEDNVGVAFVDVQQAAFLALLRAMNRTGDTYIPATGDRAVLATDPVSMQVTLQAGVAFMNGVPVYVPADLTTGVLVAPVSNPRIDIVAIDADTRAIEVFTGAEGAVPVAPTVTGNRVAAMQIYHRVGETSIKNNDDASNGYLVYPPVFTDADATPSVSGSRFWWTPTTVAAPYDITSLAGGYAGLEITIIGGNADATIKQAGTLKLSGDWTATLYHTLTVVFGGTNWFEKSRSANA